MPYCTRKTASALGVGNKNDEGTRTRHPMAAIEKMGLPAELNTPIPGPLESAQTRDLTTHGRRSKGDCTARSTAHLSLQSTRKTTSVAVWNAAMMPSRTKKPVGLVLVVLPLRPLPLPLPLPLPSISWRKTMHEMIPATRKVVRYAIIRNTYTPSTRAKTTAERSRARNVKSATEWEWEWESEREWKWGWRQAPQEKTISSTAGPLSVRFREHRCGTSF